MKKPSFHVDMNKCTGCKTCMIACMDKNNTNENILFRRVIEYSGGSWVRNADGTYEQNIFSYYVSMACNHCEDPICVKSCPTTAMHKDENGIVSVDHNKCVGCRYCELVCPYSAPQIDARLGKMTKCDFCRDYLEQGRPPACVAACPTRALTFGDYETLQKRYGGAQTFAPLPDPAITKPRLFLTANKNARQLGSANGKIQNPEEV
ncbi:DMSO/selenate family reductase complex B subunit [Desulfovibrio aminophilus]|uniref:DMSO/selenate family reductase complex B subunit n=1 Tax=Desulfovibrio aminophilus TaxID=81425 RepID=UPI00339B55B3